MGLMDKVKAQASQAAAKAQEGLKAGQAKLDEVQAAKRADALLRDLGAQVFAERTGRGDARTASEIERLLAELRDYEAENRPIDTTPTAGPAGWGPAADADPAPPIIAAPDSVPPPAAPPPGATAPESASYNL